MFNKWPSVYDRTLKKLRDRRFIFATFAAILLIIAVVLLDTAVVGPGEKADPKNVAQTALGQKIYVQHCAMCHGEKLEGQPNWRVRLPNGRLPAPPHDVTGHTWHHPDESLFAMIKLGPVRAHAAPSGYQTDMPAYDNTLTDEEIWAVLAYIKTSWTPDILNHQRNAGRK